MNIKYVIIDDICDSVRHITKKKQKFLEFAGNSDNPKGMCNRKIMKISTYEDLDETMVVWFNQ